MTPELIDETIDRVAAAMTAAPATATWSDEVRRRITESPGTRFPRMALCGLALAGVVALVAPIWISQRGAHDIPPATPLIESRAIVTLAPLPITIQHVPNRAPTVVHMALPVDVKPLTVQPLELETLADVEPLQVADIVVSDIGSEDIKEPR